MNETDDAMTTPPSLSTTVTRSDADGVATITLQAPGLSRRSRSELTGVLHQVSNDDTVRAAVLTGTGRAFCVGQDLGEHVEALRQDPATAMDVVGDSYNPMVLALAAVPVPVVVAINGACVGAGLGLALAGDLRVAAAGAKFGTAFTGIGLSSDSGLAARLVRCVGASRATELMLLSESFTAETAAQWGLVHRVVERDQVLEVAQAWAARLANGPTEAYRAVKMVLATAGTDTLEETLLLEARLQARLGGTADHREAVEAFLAKRAPAFVGR
jgi:2-(1,2-epoxy-1,2-dihydrophenyl)acetyl-CoA isomerase